MQVLDEARTFAVPGDPERSGHDFPDDAGDVIAVFVVRHAVGWRAVLDHVVDDGSRRLEVAFIGVANRNAELVFDGGEEFMEYPAHAAPARSVGIMIVCNVVAPLPTSNRQLPHRDRSRSIIPSDMASIRKPASALPPTSGSAAGDLPLGSAADAPHGSRPEQVYTRLRDLIVQGLLSPGSRIVETEIATRLGVSRTPVREALQRLQQEGYVNGSPGAQQSRLTVAPLTRDDVYELLNIVGALEGMGARGAGLLPPSERHALARELRTLNAEFQRAGKAVPIDHGSLYDADERFHRRIVEASAGPRLLALHDAVKPQAERYIRMYISMLTGDIRTSVYEHDLIIASIDEGRADDAELAVQVNWRHAADRLSKVIAVAGERGSW